MIEIITYQDLLVEEEKYATQNKCARNKNPPNDH